MANDYKQALPAGTMLRGGTYSYRIRSVLGQGSFGVTYLASTSMKGPLGEVAVPVAVKEFFASELDSRRPDGSVVSRTEQGVAHKYAKAFQRESLNLSGLKHPGIVNVLEAFEANGTYYYSMEYLPGGTLDAKVKGVGMPEKEALMMVSRIGEALSYLHDHKIMHLDLKPKNIMLKDDGSPVIIDFGLSKQYDSEGEPESSSTIGLGTPGYAPLEQVTQSSGNDFQPTLDIYALGATLFKMLTGKTPPAATLILNRKAVLASDLQAKEVSPETIDAIRKAMSPLVDDRPQRVDVFLSMLEGAGEKNGEETGEVTIIKPVLRPEPEPVIEPEPEFELEPICIPEPESEPEPEPVHAPVHETFRDRITPPVPTVSNKLPRWFWPVLGCVATVIAGVVLITTLPRKEVEETVQAPPQATFSGPTTGTAEGFNWVDLGLSVKWADRNLGASSPGDFGSYFAWGEITKKRYYTWDNLKYWSTSAKSFNKYGPVDGRMELDPSDDAARAHMGGMWRMPTFEEIKELKEKCIWKWSSQDGRGGYRVTSTVNGASIFLPTPGCRSDNKRFSADSYGYYWSSTLNPDNPEHAMGLFFNHESIGWLDSTRQIGRSIRPVIE